MAAHEEGQQMGTPAGESTRVWNGEIRLKILISLLQCHGPQPWHRVATISWKRILKNHNRCNRVQVHSGLLLTRVSTAADKATNSEWLSLSSAPSQGLTCLDLLKLRLLQLIIKEYFQAHPQMKLVELFPIRICKNQLPISPCCMSTGFLLVKTTAVLCAFYGHVLYTQTQ